MSNEQRLMGDLAAVTAYEHPAVFTVGQSISLTRAR